MAAANPVLNMAAGPDSPAWKTAVMVVNTDYTTNPPRFVIVGTAGAYTWENGDGTTTTYTLPAGTHWIRMKKLTSAAGDVLGCW